MHWTLTLSLSWYIKSSWWRWTWWNANCLSFWTGRDWCEWNLLKARYRAGLHKWLHWTVASQYLKLYYSVAAHKKSPILAVLSRTADQELANENDILFRQTRVDEKSLDVGRSINQPSEVLRWGGDILRLKICFNHIIVAWSNQRP